MRERNALFSACTRKFFRFETDAVSVFLFYLDEMKLASYAIYCKVYLPLPALGFKCRRREICRLRNVLHRQCITYA